MRGAFGYANRALRNRFLGYLLMAIVAWSIAMAVLLWFDLTAQRQEALDMALATARISWGKDMAYRKAVALMGGVYMEVTPLVKPNPNLAHVPERDVRTPSGRRLTLVNAGYFREIVVRMSEDQRRTLAHVTSLTPRKPEYAPDPWERRGLAALAAGAKDYSSTDYIGGKLYMRMIGPLVVEDACLKCHDYMGFKKGQLRGALSVSVPMEPLFAASTAEVTTIWGEHGLIWLAGILVMGLGSRDLRNKASALQEREQRYRLLFDTGWDVVLVHRAIGGAGPGRIIEANQMAANRLGYTREELLSMSIQDIDDPLSFDEAPERMRRLERDGHALFESVHVAKDGRRIPVEVSAHLFDLDGEPAVLSISRDLTARKEAEQLKTDFTSMISHELRTPLTAIVGFVSLLQRDRVSQDGRDRHRLLDRIKDRTSDMDRLVDDLLNVNRIESGGLTLSPAPVDLGPLVRKWAESVPLGPKHRLALDVATDLPPVMCDAERLHHVVANLLSNAVKFSPDGGTVRVSVERASDSVRIRVCDEGIGVAPEDLGRIFERYVQADMSSTRSFGGFGLGLFIAQRIVEAHGGTIRAESQPGKGSTFTVDLPLRGPGGPSWPAEPGEPQRGAASPDHVA